MSHGWAERGCLQQATRTRCKSVLVACLRHPASIYHPRICASEKQTIELLFFAQTRVSLVWRIAATSPMPATNCTLLKDHQNHDRTPMMEFECVVCQVYTLVISQKKILALCLSTPAAGARIVVVISLALSRGQKLSAANCSSVWKSL